MIIYHVPCVCSMCQKKRRVVLTTPQKRVHIFLAVRLRVRVCTCASPTLAWRCLLYVRIYLYKYKKCGTPQFAIYWREGPENRTDAFIEIKGHMYLAIISIKRVTVGERSDMCNSNDSNVLSVRSTPRTLKNRRNKILK